VSILTTRSPLQNAWKFERDDSSRRQEVSYEEMNVGQLLWCLMSCLFVRNVRDSRWINIASSEGQESWGVRNACNWAAIGKSRHCLNGKDWAVCGLSVYGFASSFGCRSATAMIGGRPAARMGDFTLHGGSIVLGCPMMIIGGLRLRQAARCVSLLPEQEIYGSLQAAQEIWRTGWIEEE
jgi:uncharacterized Zn-binding protein involved in type VI secretion